MNAETSTHPKPSERYLLDGTLLVEVTVVTATEVEYRTVNDADAIALGWGKTSGGYEAVSGIDDFMSRAEAAEAPQDHGPLAALLSERTLAKVLSRPAYVPRPVRPTTAEAVEAIKKRLSWASIHWGTENVSEDAWPHIADAVLNLWGPEKAS